MNQGCKYDKTHFLRNKSEEGKKIHGRLSASVVRSLVSTVFVLRMAHRKWKEIKQQPSLLPGPAVPGCSLVSFHFLWVILCPQAVDEIHKQALRPPCLAPAYIDMIFSAASS